MGNNKGKWVLIGILILLLGGFLGYRMYDTSFSDVKFEDIENRLADVDYSIVYLGDMTDAKKQMLEDTIKDTRIRVVKTEVKDLDTLNELLKKYELKSDTTDCYLILTSGNIDAVIDAKVEDARFKELVKWYFYNIIPASEIAYKVPETFEDYKNIINKNKYSVTVLGYDGCTYCNLYLPKVNDLASKYGIDIYYINKTTNFDLYSDVLDLNLDIPAKCVTSGVATTTRGKFATPMTLIIRKGKTVDCIKGDVKEEELEEMLRKYKIIKKETK